ncbi:hypothetical protein [Pseudovibrio sp. WM33]|uniref:hypothetical protein n=1 Tax=Pseudovibrio sp. WM33 TaxID=1735585 RepID=UPI0007AE5C91|nr:hypothetical protein [Pseudovibrio sp. WM33]KZL24706.1 hypothetical protein PsWM33_02380 [Pseudovibrio sp. WM33]
MRDNEIGIEEQLVIAKANQEIRDLLEKYGLRIEKGKLIFPKEDMEILRSHILFSHFVSFWKHYAIRIKLIFVCLAFYPVIVLAAMMNGFADVDFFYLFSMGVISFLVFGLGFLIQRVEENIGYWQGKRDKGVKTPLKKKWQFIPADLKRYKSNVN